MATFYSCYRCGYSWIARKYRRPRTPRRCPKCKGYLIAGTIYFSEIIRVIINNYEAGKIDNRGKPVDALKQPVKAPGELLDGPKARSTPRPPPVAEKKARTSGGITWKIPPEIIRGFQGREDEELRYNKNWVFDRMKALGQNPGPGIWNYAKAERVARALMNGEGVF